MIGQYINDIHEAIQCGDKYRLLAHLSHYREYGYLHRIPEVESAILDIKEDRDWMFAVGYADTIIGGRWEELEQKILLYGSADSQEALSKRARWALAYSRDVIKGRWFEAEQLILRDFRVAISYTKQIRKKRWPELEHYLIRTNIDDAVLYAMEMLTDRWLELEDYLLEYRNDWGVPLWSIYQRFLNMIGKEIDVWDSKHEIWE